MATATARRPARIVQATSAQLKRYFEQKLAAELGPHNVKRLIDSGDRNFVILDVRDAKSFSEGHIPGAVNMPFEELPQRMRELPKNKDVISYCWSVTCLLCTKASLILASKGYTARETIGGIAEWQHSGFPIEK